MYYTWQNIKKLYRNNKFKISASTWNDKFELPGGLYSVSDIQNYFECIIKKLETETDNFSIGMQANKIEKQMGFKIKTGYYLKF